MVGFLNFKGSWPWPWHWIVSYCILSCITHRLLPTRQISFKLKKRFADGRTDGRLRPTLLGRLRKVYLKRQLPFKSAWYTVGVCSCWWSISPPRRSLRHLLVGVWEGLFTSLTFRQPCNAQFDQYLELEKIH